MRLGRIADMLSILLTLSFSILYPFWLIEGYLDTIYLKIAVAVGAYGGFIANTIWLYKDIKRRGW